MVLDTPFDLSADAIARFQREGWVDVRGLIGEEDLAPYREAIRAANDANARQYKPIEERDTYGKAFIQTINLWVNDPVVRQFVFAKRFAKVAADLMGVKGVRLYHDQSLYKEPLGGPTPWHQDQQYWPLDGVKCVTLWMPLVDVEASQGTMKFASGSQELGYLGPENISDDSEARFEELVKARGYALGTAGAMRAGDATFHDGWTLHAAPGNSSPDRAREVMTIIYFEDGAHVSEPDSDSRRGDLKSFLGDRSPGEPADGALVPLLYRRD